MQYWRLILQLRVSSQSLGISQETSALRSILRLCGPVRPVIMEASPLKRTKTTLQHTVTTYGLLNHANEERLSVNVVTPCDGLHRRKFLSNSIPDAPLVRESPCDTIVNIRLPRPPLVFALKAFIVIS